VHQNSSADSPFVAKIKIDAFGLIFENYLVTINISTKMIQMTKMPLDSLLTYIFHVGGDLVLINIYVFRLGRFQPKRIAQRLFRKSKLSISEIK